MKSWNEAQIDMTIYIEKEIEVYGDDDNIIGKTKPYQKAHIEQIRKDEITVIIDGGEFDGYDFYWHPKEDKPEELLTKEEYSLLNVTEKKIWIELKKYIKKIDSLKEKSEDIIKLRELIKKNI